MKHSRSSVLAVPPVKMTSEQPSRLCRMMAEAGRRLVLQAGDAVFQEGDPARSVFAIARGIVATFRLTSDGRRTVLGFHFAGHTLGLLHANCHSCAAQALTPAEVVVVSRQKLEELAVGSAAVGKELRRVASEEVHAAQEQVLRLRCQSALERIAGFLLEMPSGEAFADELHLEMTRADIGDYLGMSVETVSRALTRLKQAGIIDFTTPRHVVVLRRALLAEIAEDGVAAVITRRRSAASAEAKAA